MSFIIGFLVGDIVVLHFKIWRDRKRLRELERQILLLDKRIVIEGQLTRVIEAGDDE